MKHLLLFDIDGTLVRGGPAKAAFMRAMTMVFRTDGFADGVDFSGKTDPQIARELLRGAGFGDQEIDEGFNALWARYLEELERRVELPHAVRMHWTGCPNACGQPYMGQIGLMGAKARKDGAMVEAAKIFLGGSMDADPKLAELHHKGVPLSDLPDVLEALLVERFGARRLSVASA